MVFDVSTHENQLYYGTLPFQDNEQNERLSNETLDFQHSTNSMTGVVLYW